MTVDSYPTYSTDVCVTHHHHHNPHTSGWRIMGGNSQQWATLWQGMPIVYHVPNAKCIHSINNIYWNTGSHGMCFLSKTLIHNTNIDLKMNSRKVFQHTRTLCGLWWCDSTNNKPKSRVHYQLVGTWWVQSISSRCSGHHPLCLRWTLKMNHHIQSHTNSTELTPSH